MLKYKRKWLFCTEDIKREISYINSVYYSNEAICKCAKGSEKCLPYANAIFFLLFHGANSIETNLQLATLQVRKAVLIEFALFK